MNRKVLLIDDSITIHRVIDLSIDEEKFDIEKAFSSEEANSKITSFSPDIILLDNKLDNTRIEDYVREIKGMIPAAKIILLVGAFDNFEDSDAEKIGADDYLVKPFNSGSLDDKLSALSEFKEQHVDEIIPVEEKDEAVEELMASIDTSDADNSDIGSLDDIFSDEPLVEVQSTEVVVDEIIADELTDSTDIPDSLEEIDISDDSGIIKEQSGEDSIEDFFGDLESVDDGIDHSDQLDESVAGNSDDLEIEKSGEISSSILDDIIEDDSKDNTLKETVEVLNDLEDDISLIEEITVVESLEDDSSEADIGLSLDDVVADDEKLRESDVFGDLEENKVSTEETIEVSKSIEKEEIIEEDLAAETIPVNEGVQIQSVDAEMIKGIVAEILNEEFLKNTIKEVLSKNLEKVIWEIVPDITEKLVLEEIERLKKGE